MRLLLLVSLALLLACCTKPDPPARANDRQLRERAKDAEANLTRMREAALKYYARNKAAPEMLDDLTGYGGGPADIKPGEFYSELSYTFFRLKFDDKGQLADGKFRATPMQSADAPVVMLDARTAEFEYTPKDAPEQAANAPAGPQGVELK